MARYHDIAGVLRERVECGELEVGDPMPSADRLAKEFAVGRDTALKAMKILRNEGVVALGRDSVVRVERRVGQPVERPANVVEVPANSIVRARMPTPRERDELGLTDGAPVIVVHIEDVQEVHPALGTGIRWRRAED